MTSVFDGLAGALNGIFGAPVTIRTGGLTLEITGVIRDTEIRVQGEDGATVFTYATVLRVQTGDVATLGPGDLVEQGARSWRVSYTVPALSPAADRFETFVLEAP